MKTKAVAVLFVISAFVSMNAAFGETTDHQTVGWKGDIGLYQPVQSSILIADNDKDNRGQTKKRNRLQEEDCFSDDSCLREREQKRNQVRSLERGINEIEATLRSYFRTDLTDTERGLVNTQLNAFRNDLTDLDDDYKEVLRTGSDIQPIRNRIASLYATYTDSLAPYVNPSRMEQFRVAVRTIITRRVNIRQINENRRMLTDQDEAKIERFILWVPPSQRLDYLVRVLSRVEKLIQNIGNSHMNPVRKERFLALLDEILDIVQTRISDIGNGWNDVTPPVILGMHVSWITSNSVTLHTKTNESGIGYYVILSSGSTAPSAAQVKAWQDSASQNVSLKGSGSLVSWMNRFAIAGLSPSTGYVVYFTAQDAAGNLQAIVQKVSFTTIVLPDTVPPVISALSVGTINSTGAQLSVTSNEVGIGYYVILSSGSTAPSAAQVKTWQDSASQSVSLKGSGMIVSGTVQFPIINLIADTAYTLYFSAEDTRGNMSVLPVSVSFRTLVLPDTVPPIVSNLSVSGTTSTGTILSVTVSESGSGYYVMLPSNSYIPNASQVQAGENGTGQTAPFHGSGTVSVGTNQYAIEGLSPGTGYVIYFTAADTSGNLQPNVSSVLVITSIQ